MTQTLATFQSDLFKPKLPESAQVNGGVYGAELAWWLCLQLAEQGVDIGYPEYEDFTWVLYHESQDQEFEIRCHNMDQQQDRWRIQLKKFSGGWFRKPHQGASKPASQLVAAITTILSRQSGIEDLVLESQP